MTLARSIQTLITGEIVEHLTCKFPEKIHDRKKTIISRIRHDLKEVGLHWKTGV